ncbi:MAG: AAA family ATPase, partial [Chitinispirillales bacterium]|nr:AAA family ATPase [Chitinispirillales bacterium]
MPKKLPYGQSNFADIIERGYAYVDKTRYIEFLENENNTYQFFIRPRRFGKSLFLSVLENYYDLNRKDRFDSIFGGLYIGKHPTPERGAYAVIPFDFSGLDTDSHEKFAVSFSGRVEDCVVDFLSRYRSIFPNAERDINHIRERKTAINSLNVAYAAAGDAGVPVFVVIDEYDHFANNLIAMGGTYIKEVKAGGIVRAFYESLKAGTKSVVRRIFITGITPMMINDLTSGFNMASDYSLDAMYNEMFGFTSEEVEWLMRETGVDKNLIKVDMESYYNGYMFNENGKDKVYNSQMILFLFNQILRLGEQPKDVVDTNLKTDYARLRRLAENENNREILFDIVKDGGVYGDIIGKFSLEELHNENYFVSLLFYLGMLTKGGVVEGQPYLKIPNYSIKTLYWNYAISHVQDLDSTAVSTRKLSDVISKMAFRGDI